MGWESAHNFVREDHEIVLFCNVSNAAKLVLVKDLADRVVRSLQRSELASSEAKSREQLTLTQICFVLGVIAARSSSMSTFHSDAETLPVAAEAGARIGTKTGTPPLRRRTGVSREQRRELEKQD